MKHKKICIAILIAIVTIFIGKGVYASYQITMIYEEAVKLVVQEDFEEAYVKLQGIEGQRYRDTESLIAYCKAKIAYAKGNVQRAYLDSYSLYFEYQTPEQQEKIRAFVNEVKYAHDELSRQARIEEEKAYEKKITSGVPFVGMSEDDIERTSLGKPSSEIRHNNECISGEQYRANLYDFYKGSSKVFTARCVQGEVTNVWDYRDNPIPQSSKSTTSNSTKKKTDPYNASDYIDPEDFYYDYYDDFWDYEDAEDYWNEFADE